MVFSFKTNKENNMMVESMTVFNSQEVDTKKQPMFFGAPLGIQRYDSYKYPIFDKLTHTLIFNAIKFCNFHNLPLPN